LLIEDEKDIQTYDVMMPKLDEFATFERLEDNMKTKDIPLIFLTAKAQKKEVDRGLQLGAIGYLTKPFDSMKLNGKASCGCESLETNRWKAIKINKE